MSLFDAHFLTAVAADDSPLSGILYAEDFDAIEADGVAPPPPAAMAALALTEADLAQAREEGFAAGMAAARQSDTQRLAAQTTAAVVAACDALARSEQEIVARANETAASLAKTMICLAHSMLEIEAEAQAPAQIARLLEVILPPLRHLPDVTVSVHPFMFESFSGSMKEVTGRFGGFVRLLEDETLAQADIRVDWPGGRALRLDQEFQQQLRAMLVPFQNSMLGDAAG